MQSFVEWMDGIRLISWDMDGNISFLVNGVRYNYYGGDGGVIRRFVEKYKYQPGRLLNVIKKLNLSFRKS